MGKPAARSSDMHTCPMQNPGPTPHVGGPIVGPGVVNVLIGGQPAAVVGDTCTCTGPPDAIVQGSMGVFIGGRPAARQGDTTAHGGRIAVGCMTVLIGDSAGSGGPFSAALAAASTVGAPLISPRLPATTAPAFGLEVGPRTPAESGEPPLCAGESPPIVLGEEPTPDTSCHLGAVRVRADRGQWDQRFDIRARREPLQVVAGVDRHTERITIEPDFRYGPCRVHQSDSTAVQPRRAEVVSSTGRKTSLRIHGPDISDQGHWWKNIWTRSVAPNTCQVRVGSCGTSGVLEIEAFTDRRWDVQIPLVVHPSEDESKRGTVDRVTDHGPALSILRTEDGRETDFASEWTNYVDHTLAFVHNAIDVADHVNHVVTRLGGKTFELKVQWPNLYLHGAWGYEGVPGEPRVGFAWELGFQADPLLGLRGEFDALDAILKMAAPPIGPVLAKAKAQVEKGIRTQRFSAKASIKIICALEGQVSGDIHLRQRAGDADIYTDGEIRGTITAELIGSASAELEAKAFFFSVKAGAGAAIGGEIRLLDGRLMGGGDDHGVFVAGGLRCGAGKIYSAMYVHAGVETSSHDRNQRLSNKKKSARDEASANKDLLSRRDRKELAVWEGFVVSDENDPSSRLYVLDG